MSNLINENEADQAIIKSLLRYISKSKGDNMHDVVLYKDKDGSIKRVQHFENINRDEIQQRVVDATAELQQWQDALAEFDKLNQPSETATPAPVEAPQPVLSASGVSELQPVEINVVPAAQPLTDVSVQPQAPAPMIIDVQAPPLQ